MHIQKVFTDLIDKLDRWGHALFLLLPNIVLAILLIVFFWIMAKIIDRTLRKVLKKFSVGHEVIDLTAVIVFVVITITGLFVALDVLGLDKTVTSLLAGVGILAREVAARFIPAAPTPSGGALDELRAGLQATRGSPLFRLTAVAGFSFSLLFFLVVVPFAGIVRSAVGSITTRLSRGSRCSSCSMNSPASSSMPPPNVCATCGRSARAGRDATSPRSVSAAAAC